MVPTPCSRTTPSTALGMYLGQKTIREDLMAKTEQLIAIEWASPH